MLGFEYLGREDFVQVEPSDMQRNGLAINQHKAANSAMSPVIPASPVSGTPIVSAPIGFHRPAEAKLESETKMTGIAAPEAAPMDQVNEMNKRMGDSPACPTCGHITIRSGACYKCLNCGTQTGCS